MQRLSRLKSQVLILSCALLNFCTPTPPDVPVCEYLQQYLTTDPVTGHMILKPSPACTAKINEPECGHCTYIVSGKEIYIGEKSPNFLNGKPWSKIKAESIYMPAVESYGPLITYVINSCKKMNCSDAVDRFKVKIDTLNSAQSYAPKDDSPIVISE